MCVLIAILRSTFTCQHISMLHSAAKVLVLSTSLAINKKTHFRKRAKLTKNAHAASIARHDPAGRGCPPAAFARRDGSVGSRPRISRGATAMGEVTERFPATGRKEGSTVSCSFFNFVSEVKIMIERAFFFDFLLSSNTSGFVC